ncbi:hypothetical protein Misp03_36310 [Microbispora sp. NBRC 16548]|nr:hypothetical protein Misp03_36310 [Microbispora sp. NBRC 16548]
MTPPPAGIETLTQILKSTAQDLDVLFEQMDWAENEIAAGIRRHPASADLLFHSFTLLRPTSRHMATEFVYRAHCRELLDRAATGQDTRFGTAVEVCCACCDSSQLAPLTSPAAGLYLRMWGMAFPGLPMFADSHGHHEALEGTQIDELETKLRRKLTVKERRLATIECSGLHHGKRVQCKYTHLRPDDATRSGLTERQLQSAPAAKPVTITRPHRTARRQPPMPEPLF